jgi:hypothetical protein
MNSTLEPLTGEAFLASLDFTHRDEILDAMRQMEAADDRLIVVYKEDAIGALFSHTINGIPHFQLQILNATFRSELCGRDGVYPLPLDLKDVRLATCEDCVRIRIDPETPGIA